MSFLDPGFFWGLLALLPLAAIFFLKVRPRRQPTTALFLWDEALRERRADRLFRRFRDALSLLLVAAALSAAVFAAARPRLDSDDGRDLLVIVDRSASMSAQVESGETRLDRAKREARAIVESLDGTRRVAIGTLDRELAILTPTTASPHDLLDAIERIEPSLLELDPGPLDRLARDASWEGHHRVLLLSDGASLERIPDGIELARIGAPATNVGIVACDLERTSGTTPALSLWFRTFSTLRETITTDLVLAQIDPATGAEKLCRVVPVEVPPGLGAPQIDRIEDATGELHGHFVARLRVPPEDAFAADDSVTLGVAPPQPVRVAVDAEDPYFYEHTVIAFERTGDVLALVSENPEAVVARGSSSGAALAIIFAPDGESPWWKEIGDELGPTVGRVLEEAHPVIRHTDAKSIRFSGARRLVACDGATIIVEDPDGVPLIYSAAQDGRRAVVVNLDPIRSELFLTPWFPVLVHGAATHLAGRETSVGAVYPAGATLTLPGSRDALARITTPDGHTVAAPPGRFGPLLESGRFEIEAAGARWPFGCALLSRRESDTARAEVEDTSRPVATGAPPATWLLSAAIVLLTIEAWLYHRRKVG